MNPEQALNNLITASREAKLTYNDHALCEQSAMLLRALLDEHASLKESQDSKKSAADVHA